MPCTRQPRGCHFNWSWPFVMLHATPQLSALPRPCFDCVELAVHPRTRTRSGACMSDTYMRITPTLTSADVNPLTESWAALWLELATTARRTPTRDSVNLHPCRQAAFFLPCASLPPDDCILCFVKPRQHYCSNSRCAYVTTRAGTDTMARHRQDTDEDEITESERCW